MIKIILDEQDADQLLRVLYNGTRPARVHTMVCLCGATANLRERPHAWDGWQVLPHPRCPACLQVMRARVTEELFPWKARERFMTQLAELQIGEPL
jgi:hypothetical protein